MSKRTRYAQNRIDYIVYGNPNQAARLMDTFGYTAPRSVHDLAKATKTLVQKKGRKVVKELIKIHPDRGSILSIHNSTNKKSKEDHFCGACSHYSYQSENNYCTACGYSHYDGEGNKRGFLNQLRGKRTEDLEQYYKNTLDKSNRDPENYSLAEEVEMTWNEIRTRKAAKEEEEPNIKPSYQTTEGLVMLGLVFIAGLLIGTSIMPKTRIANG